MAFENKRHGGEMSILYCAIPHFATALARRKDPNLTGRPLALIGPEERVFGVSAEVTAYGIAPGLSARIAKVRCPQIILLDADIVHCRSESEAFLQLLELASPVVEPHGWGAAYVDLGDLARHHADAVSLCKEIGRKMRRELGEILQPALGWNSTKFTALAAAKRTQPGHLMAIASAREQAFLRPLPVTLLPLGEDSLRRLGFLGLRTLGQYAALPPAAVWQQFGRSGWLAHCCARGKDDRPVVPRSQQRYLKVAYALENPLAERERLLALLQRLVGPLSVELKEDRQACGQIRLTVHFADYTAQERVRILPLPTAEESYIVRMLECLLEQMHWQAGATALEVGLERLQDAATDQLTFFPTKTTRERKLYEVQEYLKARFGANRLRQAVLSQPAAPLPEWRVAWLEEEP